LESTENYLDFGDKKLTVLLDSWAWIEYYRGSALGEKVRPIIEGSEEAYVSTINIAEVYRWFLWSYGPREAELERKTIKERCLIAPVDESTAVEAAKVRHGAKLSLGDSIILATARKFAAKVVTGDRELKGMKDVQFIE
jgi:predicted nucleic acid-binding protein